MRKYRNNKKKLNLMLIVLLVIGLGIGYAVFTQKLTIDSIASFSSMKYDVGFISAGDGADPFFDAYVGFIENAHGTLEELEITRDELIQNLLVDTILVSPTATISSDKKSITVNCDFGVSSKYQMCFVKATISNAGAFNVAVSENPIISYDDTYIELVDILWLDHSVFGFMAPILKGQALETNSTEDVIFCIRTREFTENMSPPSDLTVPITISLDFEETEASLNNIAMLEMDMGDVEFKSELYRSKIKNITFEDEINIPEEAIETWDVGAVDDGKVMAYVVPNEIDSDYFDLFIQCNEKLYANGDMSSWFANFDYVETINGLELLDTSFTVYMSSMFSSTGYNSTNFTLDVSNFDTSNVTDMSGMFYETGYSNPNFTLDVSNFDTSNVTDMSSMFNSAGYNSDNFTLDVSNFDTSNVTNMRYMFTDAGCYSEILQLDVSNFDTSKVTDMSYMFSTGYTSINFILDVSNFDTSNVTDMSGMFYETGYSNPNFTLDLSNFDTSNVTDMSGMFASTGYNSTKFITSITIRNPNTSYDSSTFMDVATKGESKITLNYTSETSDLVDQMIAEKSSDSNVVKGLLVD